MNKKYCGLVLGLALCSTLYADSFDDRNSNYRGFAGMGSEDAQKRINQMQIEKQCDGEIKEWAEGVVMAEKSRESEVMKRFMPCGVKPMTCRPCFNFVVATLVLNLNVKESKAYATDPQFMKAASAIIRHADEEQAKDLMTLLLPLHNADNFMSVAEFFLKEGSPALKAAVMTRYKEEIENIQRLQAEVSASK
jgi:hypothetical protein